MMNHLGSNQRSILRANAVIVQIFTTVGFAIALPLQGALARPVADGDGDNARATLASLQDAFSRVGDELEPAVVTVSMSRTTRGDKDGDGSDGSHGGKRSTKTVRGTGSGVIIRKDGWILTNDHVVSGADRVTVKLHDGRQFVGSVRRDFRSDLALIKVETSSDLPCARLGDSSTVKIGHWAIAIGSPYRYEGSLSVGVISSLSRQHQIQDQENPGELRIYPNMMQTDAAINPGNSGGPLVNLNGEVIGVNTAIESEGGGSVGIGFAIPINTAKFVIDQLLTKGRVTYGHLGVAPKDVTPAQAVALGVKVGAWIDEEPLSQGPAGKAGLHVGDVITALNGKAVHGESDLRTLVAQSAPFTAVDIAYVRDGKQFSVKVTLDEAHNQPQPKPRAPHDNAVARLGFEVQAITDRLAGNIGASPNTLGVVIKSIDPAGAVSDVDKLSEGSIILRINDTNTTSMQAFRAATDKVRSGDPVRILFLTAQGKYLRIVQAD